MVHPVSVVALSGRHRVGTGSSVVDVVASRCDRHAVPDSFCEISDQIGIDSVSTIAQPAKIAPATK